MILNEKYDLNNGMQIPKIGFGTWFINNKDAVQAVKDAVEQGYRLIDTAEAYMNEEGVGQGVRSCGLSREEIFVTSKVHADYKTYDEAKRAIDESISKMNIDYIDLMIIHAPQPWRKWRNKNERFFKENLEVWRALEDSKKEGKIKAIGVSNFLIDDLQNILDNCNIKPVVNQILCHIGSVPRDLIEFCQKNDIVVEGYAPLGHGKLVKNKEVAEIADKYNVSIPQVCMKYVANLGVIPIAKTTNPLHMKSNADIDFEISDEDIKKLDNIKFKGYGMMKIMPVFSGK